MQNQEISKMNENDIELSLKDPDGDDPYPKTVDDIKTHKDLLQYSNKTHIYIANQIN